MPVPIDWEKFKIPECPECKVDTFVEEITLPGAFICRACGATMTSGYDSDSSEGEKKSDGRPVVSSDSNSSDPPRPRSPVLGRMEEDK